MPPSLRTTSHYLESPVGAENFIVHPHELRDWLDAQFAPVVAKIAENLKIGEKVAAEMSKTVGQFGMTAVILKKVYEATGGEADTQPGVDED